MLNRDPELLLPLIKELENYIEFKDKINKLVSTSDVAWQIDHSLKVFNLVSETLLNSNPELYTSKFNKWRLLLFTIGYFPRGKVKAPKYVQPPENITIEDLETQLEVANKNIEKIKLADRNAHFKHFIFGVLNKKRTIRFIELHTKHHLKIIRDMIK
ncbi:DUF1569 domain-containing protein [Formosa maritima]|uniref:DUF1569 domain-containing protein n=1 Tax=Formosa maritima TaxID=2592046 RepID=A0A5D0G212_9FLAO|nr:DUF1569 domain-containing protein [Formosa maritima]TYA52976.1 DUF1569 domain-containing protein [Formosa maritima]